MFWNFSSWKRGRWINRENYMSLNSGREEGGSTENYMSLNSGREEGGSTERTTCL
jgi:hypothetical protein